jgi:hypothetical protein
LRRSSRLVVGAAAAGATLLVLTAIAMFVTVYISGRARHLGDVVPREPAVPESVLAGWPRLIGVTADPWHLDEWESALGHRLGAVMLFRAWSRKTDLSPFFQEATRRGAIPILSWEPWMPTHGKTPGWLQPAYSNVAVAAGLQDDYIRSVARAITSVQGPVVIRYAHEMNGYWYPWHNNPSAYVQAWRHVVSVFRNEGATNAFFIWSASSNIRESRETWLRHALAYWPGSEYVDGVGLTTIRSPRKPFTVAQFKSRLELLRTFGRPVWMTETFASTERPRFLADLQRFLARNRWVRGMVWSQPKTIPAPGTTIARALGRIAGDSAGRRDPSQP